MSDNKQDDSKAIFEHDGKSCLILSYPFEHDGKTIRYVKRLKRPTVADRINASKFSNDVFGSDNSDAVLLGTMTLCCEYSSTKDFAKVTEIDPHSLSEKLDYQDFFNASMLMGKPLILEESKPDTSSAE